MVKESMNETMSCYVWAEMKVMGTDDQLAGERKPEVDSRESAMQFKHYWCYYYNKIVQRKSAT